MIGELEERTLLIMIQHLVEDVQVRMLKVVLTIRLVTLIHLQQSIMVRVRIQLIVLIVTELLTILMVTV